MTARSLSVMLALVVLALVALATACSPASTTATLPQEVTTGPDGAAGQRLPEPVPRPHTDLVDTSGRPFDLAAATEGQPTLLFMGYTSCPDICPVHMAAVARAMEQVGLRAGEDLEVVFISVDPDRDTPERIREFLDHFDPGFVGATGTAEELARVAQALGLPEAVLEGDPDSGEFYTVGHPGQVLAFAADGPARLQYPFGVRASHWIADLPRLVEGTLS